MLFSLLPFTPLLFTSTTEFIMFAWIKERLNIGLIAMYKAITLALFFILPRNVSRIFVSLSVLALIYQVRQIDYRTHGIDCEKFTKLLQVSFNEDIMVLPSYTVNWFWKDEFLDKKIRLDDRHVTIREAIMKDELLFKHLKLITSTLLGNIHGVLKVKLRLTNTKERLAIKHNVMNLLIYG